MDNIINSQPGISSLPPAREQKPDVKPVAEEAVSSSDSVQISGPAGRSEKPALKELHIFHTNDIHGNIEPQTEKTVSEKAEVGGLSRMGAVVKKLRTEHPDSLLLNAGDMTQGSFESEISKGKPILDVMNYLHFDAVELGNHDFGWGPAALSGMIGEISSPVLGANVQSIETKSSIQGVKPSIMREVGGVKIGIIGVDTPKVPEYIRPEDLEGMTFPQPEEVVKNEMARLRKDGADLIIVLSHLGHKEDRDLASKIPGIDAIVGGHTHTALPEGDRVNDTLIVQAGCNNQYVGDLALTYDPSTRKIVSSSSRLIPITTDSVSPDPAIDKMIAPYLEESKKVGSEVVGEAGGEFKYSFKDVTPLGQHIADALREAAGADIALCSGKMLRAGLKQGPITKKALFNSYPNTEHIVRLKIKGEHIKDELEKRFASDSRAVILPSGFSFTVDKSRPDGDRITGITIGGKPMDMDKEYDLAVTDNQARYDTFKTATGISEKGTLRDAWFDYVKKHSPLANELDGRVSFS